MRSEGTIRGAFFMGLALVAGVACDKSGSSAGTGANEPQASSLLVQAGQQVFESHCMACHTIGEGDRTGPDLKDVHKRREEAWLQKWIRDPVSMGDTDHIGKEVAAKYGNVIMPKLNLSPQEIDQVLAFIADASKKGGFKAPAQPPRVLSGGELEAAKKIFFDRCAGCHGALRQGGTGPRLTPDRTQKIGTVNLRATLNHGREGGMPNWGELGILSTHDVDLLANYLQMPPVSPPDLGMEQVKKSWNLKVPLAQRPKAPPKRNWKNFFAVVMQKDGHLAIVDGDTKESLAVLDVGFAADIVRASASGRYLYTLARDGRVNMVDLWFDPPTIVAQVRGCFDARSIATSKAAFADKLFVEGCYWPPQYVVFEGGTLEPKHLESLRVTGDQAATFPEVRVGSIMAPHDASTWAMSLVEPGQVAIVDYSRPDFPIVARVSAEPQILDGALDHTGRYFVVPAPAKSTLSVVDLQAEKLAGTVATGKSPHLDVGANWEDPEHGWVGALPLIGESKLQIFGADPKGHADEAWKVVREITGVAAGALFVRTHPKSPWVWVDSPANQKEDLARQVCVIDKKTAKVSKCWKPFGRGRVMDFAYDQNGSEVWISGWDKKGAILVYDDATLKEKQRIEGDWVVTPSRKYNVQNLTNDAY
jgi:nitrite reductase (NO-forming) / hydroxylamine reductase